MTTSRRNLFFATLAALGGALFGAKSTMPRRQLGRTQVYLPILGLGGSASPLSRFREEGKAVAIIERALSLGIRYFDTAANYGPSEVFLGKVLPKYRNQVFLATKTSARDRDGAWRDLENSLKRLQTDRIDLWQFHALTYDWDIDTILDHKKGAIRAYEEAHKQGIVRFVGVTGHHNPQIIAKSLQRYPFHTALIPINAADIHTPQPFIKGVLPIARQQNVGIIAMKVPAYGRLLKVLKTMDRVLAYALSQPGVHTSIIATETIGQLEENVKAAVRLQALSAQEISKIEQLTLALWQENSFFRSWG